MTKPEVVLCPDGHFRRVVYGIGPYIADYPEQVLISCIVQNWCPRFVNSGRLQAVSSSAHESDPDAQPILQILTKDHPCLAHENTVISLWSYSTSASFGNGTGTLAISRYELCASFHLRFAPDDLH